ncbi:MAG TPA: ABC transporter ATP-binding protein [Nocardioidaceae bacterium]|nr:ABC transporter ATP-binding protein [Nocardioidaceae bacterium]
MPRAAASAAVEVRDLVMRYRETTAVDGLSLDVRTGAITALLGPNGAGKTTTVETCEGYRQPQAGSVRVLGLDPAVARRELLPRIGVMLQSGGAWSAVRAAEMLRHIAALHLNPLSADLLLARLGLEACARTPYRRLSGGQRQRLGLAMAMVGRPELLFVDEPTAGLDPQGRRVVWDLLAEARSDGVTIVLTTHLLDEAERLADEVVVIDHGRVLTCGSPAELTRGRGKDKVTFRARPGLDLTSLRAVLPVATLVEEETAGHYVVRGEIEPQTLAELTAWCAAQQVMPEDLSVGRRTLEEVFLELTGPGTGR